MESAYAQVETTITDESNATSVVMFISVRLFRTNGQPGPSFQFNLTLPYTTNQNQWKAAIVDGVVSGAAQQDVEAVGGYSLVRIFFAELTVINP